MFKVFLTDEVVKNKTEKKLKKKQINTRHHTLLIKIQYHREILHYTNTIGFRGYITPIL